jgi:hypothetical protein
MVDSFWQEVGQAYERVFTNPSEKITVEQNGKRASVIWSDFDFVSITVTEVPVEPPTLIAP